MKTSNSFLLIFSMLAIISITNSAVARNPNISDLPAGWEIIHRSEFNDRWMSSVVGSNGKWKHNYPYAPRKLGQNHPSQFSLINESGTGFLRNKISKDSVNGGKHVYRSGMLKSIEGYKLGREVNNYKELYFETRVRLPSVLGPQSAFWLSTSVSPVLEIDVFEYLHKKIKTAHHTVHRDFDSTRFQDTIQNDDFWIGNGNWHTFGLRWSLDSNGNYELAYYIDDRETGKQSMNRFSDSSHKKPYSKVHMLLSAEIGRWGVCENGEPNPINKTGQIYSEDIVCNGIGINNENMDNSHFDVDYIRVFGKK